MKRIIFIVAMVSASVTTFAQSILGIKVGESYTNAKNALNERYSYKLTEDSGNLTLSNFEMGDFDFNYGTLYFQWSNNDAKFYKAEFQKWTTINDAEYLKRNRETLVNKLKSKYQIFEFKNNQGYKGYEFLGEETNGVIMHGSIEITRTKGKDGVERVYLFLTYNPVADFINENSDF